MSSAAASDFPDSSGLPDCFLPESGPIDLGGHGEQDLVVPDLPDGGKLPKVLEFKPETPPQWKEPVPLRGCTETEEAEGLRAEECLDEYAAAFADAKTRLTTLIAGFEGEKREAEHRLEQLELSTETLRYHLGRMERFQTAGLSRARLIRELERGLVALDAAEQDLELECDRTGVSPKARISAAKPKRTILKEWLARGRSFALMQAGAFVLPLLVFLIIVLILIGTALGWF